jgi:hypothetical protein
MRGLMIIAAALTLAACSGQSSPVANEPQIESPVVADLEPAAPEKDEVASATPEQPEQADKEPEFDPLLLGPLNRTRVVLLRRVGATEEDKTPRGLAWTSEEWRGANHRQRVKGLETLRDRGSDWARGTLEKLDNGEYQAEDLVELGDQFEAAADEVSRPSIIMPATAGDGCAPMPFGKSMFGPWDTGTSPNRP